MIYFPLYICVGLMCVLCDEDILGLPHQPNYLAYTRPYTTLAVCLDFPLGFPPQHTHILAVLLYTHTHTVCLGLFFLIRKYDLCRPGSDAEKSAGNSSGLFRLPSDVLVTRDLIYTPKTIGHHRHSWPSLLP
jgi:hypothetical protein